MNIESDFEIIEDVSAPKGRRIVRKGGTPSAPEAIGLGVDSGDQLSDDQLRAAIETATGKAPHHKLGRDKLIEQCNALNAEQYGN